MSIETKEIEIGEFTTIPLYVEGEFLGDYEFEVKVFIKNQGSVSVKVPVIDYTIETFTEAVKKQVEKFLEQ